jgi:hypothetical protein
MLRTIGLALLALVLLGLGAWVALVLLYAGTDAGPARTFLATAMAVLTIACGLAVLLGRSAWQPIMLLLPPLVAVLVWFRTLEPRNDRIWPRDVERMPWAELHGDRVTFHEVRNFAWRSETDFTSYWETRTVDLAKLEGVDLVASY